MRSLVGRRLGPAGGAGGPRGPLRARSVSLAWETWWNRGGLDLAAEGSPLCHRGDRVLLRRCRCGAHSHKPTRLPVLAPRSIMNCPGTAAHCRTFFFLSAHAHIARLTCSPCAGWARVLRGTHWSTHWSASEKHSHARGHCRGFLRYGIVASIASQFGTKMESATCASSPCGRVAQAQGLSDDTSVTLCSVPASLCASLLPH